jgi:hypothetical protein
MATIWSLLPEQMIKFYDDPIEVTLIFDTLRFSDFPTVNLPKIYKHTKQIYAAKLGNEYLEDVPWCFRYIKIHKNDEI